MHHAKRKRILYGVSSVGLGHARRSVSIAKKLRAIDPEVEIDWIAAEPVKTFLESSSEKPLEISSKLESIGSAMELLAEEGKISDMSRVARLSARLGKKNYELIKPVLSSYDILIQDEFIETLFASLWDKASPLPEKRVLITDYSKFETNSLNPINRLVIWYANRSLRKAFASQSLRIFADSTSDSRVLKNFHVVGPILDDLPLESKSELRRALFGNPGNTKIIVFTIGGTKIGRNLVEFVVKHSEEISHSLGNAHLVVLLGPGLEAKEFKVENTCFSLVSFTKDSPKYFKASDCVVTQAGASTMNEVSFLGVPCVCVPIGNHWEQRDNAKRFQRLYGFELLKYDGLSVTGIVSAIESAIQKKDRVFLEKRVDASTVVAKLILEL